MATKEVSDLRDTIVPKSDQLNAEQLLSGPMTIRVSAIRRGTDDQPVILNYDGDNGRPYKPCKTMRKVLIYAWGDDGHEWVGRSMTLYNDPNVKFGGVKVGGIRISHLSHINGDVVLALTVTKGKKDEFLIRKLTETGAQASDNAWLTEHLTAISQAPDMAALKAAYDKAYADVRKYGTKADAEAIVDAKDRRKAVLVQPAGTVIDGETGEVV